MERLSAQMAADFTLYYSVVLAWALNIFFFSRFAAAWYRREPSKTRALLALAAVAVPAAAMAFFLPPRAGYDNNHDFLCLGSDFFTTRPRMLLYFKEVSPLFTDAVSDLLSNYSLAGVLWKNRALSLLSIFALFAGLRRLGAGLTVSAAGAAFFALNFLALLNASAFATTSSNVFIWLLSLLAVIDAYAAGGPATGGLAWMISSMVLVISARFEFLPPVFLMFAALLCARFSAQKKELLKTLPLALLLGGGCLLALWSAHALEPHPANQLAGGFTPARNLVTQLGARNLAFAAGAVPRWTETLVDSLPGVDRRLAPAAVALPVLLLLLSVAGIVAGGFAGKENTRRNAVFLALLAAWIGYMSAIYSPMDTYPLHFMRHQLYFLLPFAFLLALGLDGYERAAGGREKAFRAILAAAVCAYAALNARAALSLNDELRTNDRELAFLMEAQRAWPRGCLAVHPSQNQYNTRADLLKKYFPMVTDRAPEPGACLLKYVSPEPKIFSASAASPLDQPPLLAGPRSEPWRKLEFRHGYYTALARPAPPNWTGNYIRETVDPVPLTIGFFKFEAGGRDSSYLDSLAGADAFGVGEYAAANRKFRPPRPPTRPASGANISWLSPRRAWAAGRRRWANLPA